MKPITFDTRRTIVNPGDKKQTIKFCVEHFLKIAKECIKKRDHFYVALSGGSTPNAIYQQLALPENAKLIDWKKVTVFWSDERCVPPDHEESNYRMAMESGISKLPIPKNQLFRMKGELNPYESAVEYNDLIGKYVPDCRFDLIMLGMGDDGHTASLFPFTEGLESTREAIANYVPSKRTWRLTLTFACINRAEYPTVYVLGSSKAYTIERVFKGPNAPEELPIQQVGTKKHPALWIMDNEACKDLFSRND